MSTGEVVGTHLWFHLQVPLNCSIPAVSRQIPHRFVSRNASFPTRPGYDVTLELGYLSSCAEIIEHVPCVARLSTRTAWRSPSAPLTKHSHPGMSSVFLRPVRYRYVLPRQTTDGSGPP